MWKWFQRQRLSMEEPIPPISPEDLSSLFVNCRNKPITFDLRGHKEIDLYPYAIPGALLTTNVSLPTLMPSIPPRSTVVLYAAEQTPTNCRLARWRALDSRFYVLKGGLRAWWEAHLPLESVQCSRHPSSISRGARR